jgi:SAM-dependent methyltransferase
MAQDQKMHWQKIYGSRAPTEMSWYEPVPSRSIELILATGLPRDAPIIDVGGGASTLVDHLLGEGFTDVTVLDIAPAALAVAKARLGAAAEQAQWLVTDVAEFRPTRRYAIWHDRAVFHFLTDAAHRRKYLDVLEAALASGGYLVLATFGLQGPTRCSGLDVQRYSDRELSAVLGRGFELVRSYLDEHVVPGGGRQQLLYGLWRAGLR